MRAIIYILPVLIAFLIGCKKKEIQGPQGDPGIAGAGGNANISSTNTFVVNGTQWLPDSTAGALKATIAFPALTKEIVEKGAVKVFRQMGTTWTELPYDSGDLLMQFGFKEGSLSLYYINIEGGFPAGPGTGTYRMTMLSLSARPGRDIDQFESENLVENTSSINEFN